MEENKIEEAKILEEERSQPETRAKGEQSKKNGPEAKEKGPREKTSKGRDFGKGLLGEASKVLWHVKLELKLLAFGIAYLTVSSAFDNLFYMVNRGLFGEPGSLYAMRNLFSGIMSAALAALASVILIYDLIQADKEEYFKNSYYEDFKNRRRKYPKTKRGGTMNALAMDLDWNFDLIFILGGLILLSLMATVLSGNEGLYVLASAGGGVIILVQASRIRKKLLDERLAYLDEIAEATQAIVDGKMSVLVPEKAGFPMLELAQNINKIREGYGTALEEQLKSERMKTELITNVSHDLKTPLTSIINYVDLLKKEDLLPEYARDYVAILDQKSQRLNTLIQDLFQVSRAASGDIDLNIETLDVAQLLRQTLAEMSASMEKSGLNFILSIPDQEILVQADGEKLHRVFENLISNILKYSLQGSRVYLEVHEKDGVQIVMKNISSYEMNFTAEEITQRFSRADLARTTEGSGLGLAICKSLLDLMKMQMKLTTDGDLFKVEIHMSEKI